MSSWTKLIHLQLDRRKVRTVKLRRVREDCDVYRMRGDDGQERAVRGRDQLLDGAVNGSGKDLEHTISNISR